MGCGCREESACSLDGGLGAGDHRNCILPEQLYPEDRGFTLPMSEDALGPWASGEMSQVLEFLALLKRPKE
jgi:hypothetical protein